MYSNSNDAYTPDVEIVATNTGGNKVTKLPFGDENVKAEEYNSPKRWRDQVAETATLLGITGSTRNKKFLIAGLGSAALLALAWSVPSMKESHVNKNSAAVVRKPASAKSSKAPFAKVTKAKAPKASGSDSPSFGPSFAPSKSDGQMLGPSLTPSASGGPTLGPSLAPSASGGPTLGASFAPSASGGPTLGLSFAPSASGGPTLGPSLSPEPSSSPDPLSLYELMGGGYCVDSQSQAPQQSNRLPSVKFHGSAALFGPSGCGSKCTECVSVDGAVSNGSFRGFTLDYDCGACHCHVDVGSMYDPGAGGAGCAGTISDDGCACDGRGTFAGTGDILGVLARECVVCYKYLPEES